MSAYTSMWQPFMLDYYLNIIKKENRITFARKQILEMLLSKESHLTVDDLMTEKIGIATLYRTLDMFESLGIVESVVKNHSKYYKIVDPADKHHVHFICTNCNRILEYDDPVMLDYYHKMKSYMKSAHNLQMEDQLTLRGDCVGCD